MVIAQVCLVILELLSFISNLFRAMKPQKKIRTSPT